MSLAIGQGDVKDSVRGDLPAKTAQLYPAVFYGAAFIDPQR